MAFSPRRVVVVGRELSACSLIARAALIKGVSSAAAQGRRTPDFAKATSAIDPVFAVAASRGLPCPKSVDPKLQVPVPIKAGAALGHRGAQAAHQHPDVGGADV